MTINIAGASGFVGRHLSSSFETLAFDVNRISLRGVTRTLALEDDDGILINLIGKAHDHDGEATEQDFYEANLGVTKLLFQSFITSRASLFIHVSSIAALEEFESDQPLQEEDPPNPSSWYGKSKREAELWLLSQQLPADKKMIILRPPMIHGSGDKGNLGLLYKFISKGIPYPLVAFNNERSCISIDNFVYLMEQVIETRDQIVSGVYHVADDEPLSTNEIISIIQYFTNKKGSVLSIPKWLINGLARCGDYIPIIPLNTKRLKKMTSNLLVSNEKIKMALGIHKLPLTAKEGMVKTIQSFLNTAN